MCLHSFKNKIDYYYYYYYIIIIQYQVAFVNCLYVARFTIVHSNHKQSFHYYSSSAYCTRSNRSLITLQVSTDRYADFVTVKYATV